MTDEQSLHRSDLVSELQKLRPAQVSIHAEELFYRAGWDAAQSHAKSSLAVSARTVSLRSFAIGIISGIAATMLVVARLNFVDSNSTAFAKNTSVSVPSKQLDSNRDKSLELEPEVFGSASELDEFAGSYPVVWRRFLISLNSQATESVNFDNEKLKARTAGEREVTRAELLRELSF